MESSNVQLCAKFDQDRSNGFYVRSSTVRKICFGVKRVGSSVARKVNDNNYSPTNQRFQGHVPSLQLFRAIHLPEGNNSPCLRHVFLLM